MLRCYGQGSTQLPAADHTNRLRDACFLAQVRSAIIFTSTCRACHALSYLLEELGMACTALHSGKNQRQRMVALHRFRSGQVPLLLATDVASRGLDIPTVDLVVNFDLPVMARDYVHRCVRTGACTSMHPGPQYCAPT